MSGPDEVQESPVTPSETKHRLREVGWFFLKLGSTAFGGPAVHVAMMEEEVVRRRKWLSHQAFLDLLGATNLIPGPNSTEMAIHLGYLRAGWPGLLLAGVSFILPAALLVGGIAWLYVRFGRLPQAAGFLYGVKPVIIAVILQALWGLGRTAVKTRALALLGCLAALANLCGLDELTVVFGGGCVMMLAQRLTSRSHPEGPSFPLSRGSFLLALAPAATGSAAVPFGLWPLFLFFLKVGSVLFGGGYVLVAYIRTDLVERFGWLTEAQLLDAIVVGQMTPGPLFTTATFIGYLLGGPWGACVATVGIFLPSFILVSLSGPLVPRLRRSPTAGAFLDGVNVASLALMAVVTLYLSRVAIVDWPTGLLAVAGAVALIRFRVNSIWLILIGAVLGLVMT